MITKTKRVNNGREPIDYGETFEHKGKLYVQIMDKRHCAVCAFWQGGNCKADDGVPACLRAPIAFVEVKIPKKKGDDK